MFIDGNFVFIGSPVLSERRGGVDSQKRPDNEDEKAPIKKRLYIKILYPSLLLCGTHSILLSFRESRKDD
jgi:hypothetical protein